MILETIVLNPARKRRKSKMAKKKKKKWYGNARKKKTKKRATRKKAPVRRRKATRKKATRRRKTTKRKVKRNAVKRYTIARGVAPNKRKRRKAKRKKSTRKRRRNVARNQVYRYQISPVAANPFARNKGVMAGAADLVKSTLVSPDFWMNWIAPLGAGFFGSKLAAYQLANLLLGDDAEKKAKYWDKPYAKAAWQAGTGVLAGAGVALATRSKAGGMWGAKLIAGSLLASVLTLLEQQDFYKKYTGMDGLSGLGADVSSELKRKIASSIREEIESAEGVQGLRDFVTAENLPGGVDGMNDFVSVQELPATDEGINLSQW